MITPVEAVNILIDGYTIEVVHDTVRTYKIYRGADHMRLDWHTNDSRKGPGFNGPLDNWEMVNLLVYFLEAIADGATIHVMECDE